MLPAAGMGGGEQPHGVDEPPCPSAIWEQSRNRDRGLLRATSASGGTSRPVVAEAQQSKAKSDQCTQLGYKKQKYICCLILAGNEQMVKQVGGQWEGRQSPRQGASLSDRREGEAREGSKQLSCR